MSKLERGDLPTFAEVFKASNVSRDVERSYIYVFPNSCFQATQHSTSSTQTNINRLVALTVNPKSTGNIAIRVFLTANNGLIYDHIIG